MTEAQPIRILHLADIHLGVESYGTLDPATGVSRRVGDFLHNLDLAVEEAVRGDIDLVLMAGDYYRTRDPNPTFQREFARRIRRLSEAGLPVFMLTGNHDLPAAQGRASSIEIFEALGVPGVVTARRPEVFRLETRRGPLQILALPWITRAAFLTRDELRGKTIAEIDAMILEAADRIVRAKLAELDPALPHVMAVHGTVQGAVWGSERQVMLGQDLVLPRAMVMDPAIDYVALGHIHKHQVLSHEPLTIYPGSIDRVDFGEAKEDKGYVVAEVWRGGARYQFRPLPARRFVDLELTAAGEMPTPALLAAIEQAQVADAVVKLVVNVPPELDGQVDFGAIRAACRHASFVAAITKKLTRTFRRGGRDGRFAEELTPLEALEAYLQSRDETPERIKSLLELAEPLVREA